MSVIKMEVEYRQYSILVLCCLLFLELTGACNCFAASLKDLGHLPAVFKLLFSTDQATANASLQGYNLFTSLNSRSVFLMDNQGNFVHSWETGYQPANSQYLLENGELLHTGALGSGRFATGGAGGLVQKINWHGETVWTYQYSSETHLQHHDIEMLPNGNVLMIAWQYKSGSEALAAGRDPSRLEDGELWAESVIEVRPIGKNSGEIVWEWHVWDHLVQDHDPDRANYGTVADHPELIDLNYAIEGEDGKDWNHCNAIDYNEDLDQILLSVRHFSEVWVIDHSTTTVEAASHSGGTRGRGGDLLYRWGNPQAYDRGTEAERQLFVQHDAEWIDKGIPGEGNILVFNNGEGRPQGNYSSVDEIVPPVNQDGRYPLAKGSTYGPDKPIWTYTAAVHSDFYANNISSQQRLANGNTLICNGPKAYFFEVDPQGKMVWEYSYSGQVFHVERYDPSYPGFNGTPLDDDTAGLVSKTGGPSPSSEQSSRR